jgi:hypothetical protein
MENDKMINETVDEAKRTVPSLKAGGEVGYLSSSTGGHLRVGLSHSGEPYVVGAGDSEWLARIAAEIEARLRG